jgi:hypothetical protein
LLRSGFFDFFESFFLAMVGLPSFARHQPLDHLGLDQQNAAALAREAFGEAVCRKHPIRAVARLRPMNPPTDGAQLELGILFQEALERRDMVQLNFIHYDFSKISEKDTQIVFPYALFLYSFRFWRNSRNRGQQANAYFPRARRRARSAGCNDCVNSRAPAINRSDLLAIA